MSLLPIDEINALLSEAQRTNSADLLSRAAIEIVEEYLQAEYDESYYRGIDGWLNAAPDEAIRTAAIYAEVDGKTFADRIDEYASDDLDKFIVRITALLHTDGHRVRSEGTLAAGADLQSVGLLVEKRWRDKGDKDVRDAHHRLDGVTIPYDELFEIDGFVAPAPGLFGVADLDCNCRCELEIHVTV